MTFEIFHQFGFIIIQIFRNDVIDEHICNSVMNIKWTTSTKRMTIKFNLLILLFGMQKDFDPLKIFMHIHLS